MAPSKPIYIALTKNFTIGSYVGYKYGCFCLGIYLPFFTLDIEFRKKGAADSYIEWRNEWEY